MRDNEITIAVDAMGGDRAPEVVVQGCIEAARGAGDAIILVGDESAINREWDRIDASRRQAGRRIRIHHCTQAAEMAEPPAMVLRQKKDASIKVAFELVKAGRASAVVSAGNSGATLAAAVIVLGRMKGVDRPGIATILPTVAGKCVLIDVGANVDCKPAYLFQFGVMAEAYARTVFNLDRPRVALLSIGEEDAKGNVLVRKAHELLRASAMNFIGNIEGRDLFLGRADVVVCDGFIGNIVLKLSEAMAEVAGGILEQELRQGSWPKVAGLLFRNTMQKFQNKIDYAEFGGAPLLGVKGTGIISHGRSSPKAIANAIRTAAEFARAGLPERLQDCLDKAGSRLEGRGGTE